jgi:hypothetical protein
MSDQAKSPLESILFLLMEKASAKFSETDLVVSPETMTTTVVDLAATPEFWASLWTAETKRELAAVITPYVRAWYEERLTC